MTGSDDGSAAGTGDHPEDRSSDSPEDRSDDRYYHVDGDLVPAADATVSVRDRGFMYGDAAFETLRAYGGDLFEWAAHADRLRETCASLALDHGLSDADLRKRIEETLAANDLRDAYVRLSVTRGVQPGKLTPSPDVDPTVVVIVKPLPRGGRGSDPVWDGPATLRTVETRRVPDRAIPADAKTHNYLNGILARLELRAGGSGDEGGGRCWDGGGAGDRDGSGTGEPTRAEDAPAADEAVVLDADGNVAEGATSNLFFVADEALRTPSLDGPVLPGVTRSVVLDLAESEAIPVREGSYEPGNLRRADEAFVTNTTWEVRPIEAVDGIEVGGGPVTELLSRLFDERVERLYGG